MKTMSVYTQGVDDAWMHDGSYEVKQRGEMTLEQFMAGVRLLPMPQRSFPHQWAISGHRIGLPCPPCIGFNESPVCGNVSRSDGGTYFLLVGGYNHDLESRSATIDEIEVWAKARYQDVL